MKSLQRASEHATNLPFTYQHSLFVALAIPKNPYVETPSTASGDPVPSDGLFSVGFFPGRHFAAA